MPAQQQATEVTIPVSAWALRQRINRHLRAKGRELRLNRSHPPRREFFIVERSKIVAEFSSIERLGRDLGLLEPWEILARQ
jgi:hypothetical protein